MRMLQRSSGGFAMVFEDHDVLEAAVLFQVDHAVAEGPQNIFHSLYRHGGQRFPVVGRFNHPLMRAGSLPFVKHAISLVVQAAFDSQGGELVGYHAQVPAGSVAVAVFARTVGQNFRRCPVLIAGTERAETGTLNDGALTGEVAGALGAVGGDNYPAARDRIFSHAMHTTYLHW